MRFTNNNKKEHKPMQTINSSVMSKPTVVAAVTQTDKQLIDPDTSTQKKRERFPAMQCYVDRVYNCFDSSSKDKEPAKKKATINTYLPEEKLLLARQLVVHNMILMMIWKNVQTLVKHHQVSLNRISLQRE